MPEAQLHELTKSHDDALVRLEMQESSTKKTRNYLIITALTALLGGSGSATALLGNDDESVKTVVATHVAVDEMWKAGADADIGALIDQQKKLRDAVLKLQFTVEGLSDKRRGAGGGDLRARLDEVEGLLSGMDPAPKRRARKDRGAPTPESVQRLRGELFE